MGVYGIFSSVFGTLEARIESLGGVFWGLWGFLWILGGVSGILEGIERTVMMYKVMFDTPGIWNGMAFLG